MIEVKVLGTGCRKCSKLYDEVQIAITESGVEVELTKVEKLDEIASYGVLSTPALVVGGQVKSTGKLPKPAQIAEWIKQEAR
jgi:small redox-active disulfide protein 2